MIKKELEKEIIRLEKENLELRLGHESRSIIKHELRLLKSKLADAETSVRSLKPNLETSHKTIEKLNTKIHRMKNGVCYDCGEPFDEDVPAESRSGLVVGIHKGCY